MTTVGWVGYLFTEIEESTQRWERVPEQMQRATKRHDEIVDSQIAMHGGSTVHRAGDGIFALFEKGSSIECAVELQRAREN
ncbi:MAG: hypothetical protein AAGA68_25790 [Pseudomonadota bacterium]